MIALLEYLDLTAELCNRLRGSVQSHVLFYAAKLQLILAIYIPYAVTNNLSCLHKYLYSGLLSLVEFHTK